MSSTELASDSRFINPRFPRSNAYHPKWILAGVSGGANSLWMTEWLAEKMDLKPGMRVLDLGCGRGASSIFLHREYGVDVWSVDRWFSPNERLQRIQDAQVQKHVFPIRGDARDLPFAHEYFDAIVCIDCYIYFGSDDNYMANLARFVKPKGQIGIAGAGITQEINDVDVPAHLRKWWSRDCWILHSSEWWKRHWQRSEVIDVLSADTMPDGWRYWLDWHQAICPENHDEIEALKADQGRYLGYVRVVGNRKLDVAIDAPIDSIPTTYESKPLHRSSPLGT